ncbi:MAG TPA: Na/Pi symporter [Thermoanaerobaculia bacterium]|nr:Na/Pi symporter [Thermoanaerobaculia bacterium]
MHLRTGLLRLLLVCLFLFGFLVGLEMMGLSFKLFGKGLAERLMSSTANPFVGLFIGVLATSLVQSSSTTTSMTVGLVAGGALTIEGAIPIVMGANIGTSVTNTLVSLAHITRREEFRRAFAGATLHDFFNWLTVLVLLPVEIATGYLSRTAGWLTARLEGVGGIDLFNPVKAVVAPVAAWASAGLGGSPWGTLLVGVGLTFVAIKFLVDLLKAIFSSRAEQVLHRTLFRSTLAAIAAGAAITVMVQSSSITTSAVIPLVGAGVVTLEQLFPFTVGANLGTTVTALLAALVSGSPAAVAVAISHLLFNLNGTALVYCLPPVRRIPLALARWLGDVGFRNRPAALGYVLAAFYGLPLALLLITGALDREPPSPPAAAAPADPSPAAENP